MSQSYALNPFHQFLSHGSPLPIALLRDGLDGIDSLKAVDVQVMSGDYFATLATTLDGLLQSLPDKTGPEADRLHSLIEDLLHLQQHYRISRK
jgi:hypothetical protein